jgi:hypothetical protein
MKWWNNETNFEHSAWKERNDHIFSVSKLLTSVDVMVKSRLVACTVLAPDDTEADELMAIK